MMLVGIGSLMVIGGVVMTAMATLRRGRLSEPPPPRPDSPRDTLEPSGPGRRLSVKGDLPGLALMGLGAVLLLVGSAI